MQPGLLFVVATTALAFQHDVTVWVGRPPAHYNCLTLQVAQTHQHKNPVGTRISASSFAATPFQLALEPPSADTSMWHTNLITASQDAAAALASVP